MSLTNHEKYKLTHNREWIESLEGCVIDSYSVDFLENQWMLYKEPYTEEGTDEFRLQTSKNKPGKILLRKKNDPFGFKVTAVGADIDSTGRQYQANVSDEDLRKIFNGQCYHLEVYDNYGVAFGLSDSDWISVLFEIKGTILNIYDEEFIDIGVLSKHTVTSLYSFVDSIIYNNVFYTITYAEGVFNTYRFNIADESNVTPTTHSVDFSAVQETSTVNDLTGLSYHPVESRIITINGIPEEKIGRIWSIEYSDDGLFLAYECLVPSSRSSITGVTEGIVLMEMDKDVFLDSTTGTPTLYVFDTIDGVSKLIENPLCQAFIPESTDGRGSFGNSISVKGNDLVVGSDREEAIYIYDLNTTDTPDIFSTDFPTLPTNGTKISKDYTLEQRPIFPIRMNAGTMDFEVFGGTGIKWAKPDGTFEYTSHPVITLAAPGIIYLIMDSFKDNVTIDAHATTGFAGLLSDVPDTDFGIKYNGMPASGSFNAGTSLTDIDIQNTDLTQADLELCAIVLHEAGNLNGTLDAEDGMPSVTDPEAVGAVNSLIAKGWNITINMPFHPPVAPGDPAPGEPEFNIIGSIPSGVYCTIESFYEDPFQVFGSIASGAYELAIPDQLIVAGATNTPDADGTYDLNGTLNSRPKWTKDSAPFNDIAYDGSTDWEILHDIPASGSFFYVTDSSEIAPQNGYTPGFAGTAPSPTISYVHN